MSGRPPCDTGVPLDIEAAVLSAIDRFAGFGVYPNTLALQAEILQAAGVRHGHPAERAELEKAVENVVRRLAAAGTIVPDGKAWRRA